MEYSHSSLRDSREFLSNFLADRANGADVYTITGEGSRLAQSILRFPRLQRSVMVQEINKLERMKTQYEDRMKKIANSFLCRQTAKAMQWQAADKHWAVYTANRMPSYRNNSFKNPKKSGSADQEAVDARCRKRRDSLPVLYHSADYSNIGDKTYYRLMQGNTDITKAPPVGLNSGPRLEFVSVNGKTSFNKVTYNTTKEVVNSYSKSLQSRNKLLSQAVVRSKTFY